MLDQDCNRKLQTFTLPDTFWDSYLQYVKKNLATDNDLSQAIIASFTSCPLHLILKEYGYSV
jgi:hypothetical protein